MRLPGLLQRLVARWCRAQVDPMDAVQAWAERPTTPAFLAEAEVRRQLDWRGPTQKRMNHVIIPRLLAAALIEYEDES